MGQINATIRARSLVRKQFVKTQNLAMSEKPKTESRQSLFQALNLAWELGYTIAIPLVVLALGGRLLDKRLGTSPWLLLAGVLVSIVITTWLVYRKTKRIVSGLEADSNSGRPEDEGNGKEDVDV